MSSDHYRDLWLQVLRRLENLVNLDTEYQLKKTHDQKRCHASLKLGGVLGEYCCIYNDALECLRNNLQVQRTVYIVAVINAVVERILELKHQLQKLESSNYQFLGHGLVQHKITTDDAELKELHLESKRPDEVKLAIQDAFKRVKVKKETQLRIEEEKKKAEEEHKISNNADKWWEDGDEELSQQNEDRNKFTDIYAVKKTVDAETLEKRKLITLIIAHEKTRQVTKWVVQTKQKRELWKRELAGTLKPLATDEIRERSAKFIQQVFRTFFKLKLKKREDCKIDELLCIKYCKEPIVKHQSQIMKLFRQIANERSLLKEKYEQEWKQLSQSLKRKYYEKRHHDIAEDFRDEIRQWFFSWFKQIKVLYEIPHESKGGSISIVKDEVPTPSEWLEKYNAFMEDRKGKIGKSFLQLKWEKKNANKEEALRKREEKVKHRSELILKQKIMKNPKLHPGFLYPLSKKTEMILKSILNYHKEWDQLDLLPDKEVKKGFLRDKVVDEICSEVKLEVRKQVDEDMRLEYKTLNKALKMDYQRNGEKMPDIKKKSQRKIKRNKILPIIDEHIVNEFEDLIHKGILKEYPLTKFEYFHGEYNYAGDDLRCQYKPAQPFAGETRNIWWERSREVLQGFHRILLVGPAGSGKTLLVHALATANDAVLFELDPTKVADELLSSLILDQVVKSVAKCAKTAQPAVIYIRHVQKLFYRKIPKEEANWSLDLIKRYFIDKLCKKINKSNNVTIVGACTDPWLARSPLMMKRFPGVVLMPPTSYSTIVQMLNLWVLRNHTLPRDLDVHSLAQVLQGYRLGYLKQCLDNFLTAERIVKIAAFGLTIQEVYDYIISDETEEKVDFAKYRKWYSEKTHWGQKEARQIQKQLEFRDLSNKWKEKAKKKGKKQNRGKNPSRLIDY